MNSQTFAHDQGFKAITDEELMAVNGGFFGMGGSLFGGMYAGVAANAIGVELPARGGAAGIGQMITNHH
ncbi:hypothetical protein OAL60_00740 [bacterium]|nr:hypothetical protein [bacterium]